MDWPLSKDNKADLALSFRLRKVGPGLTCPWLHEVSLQIALNNSLLYTA